MNSDSYSAKDIGRGYVHDKSTNRYQCIVCRKVFEEGEIFEIGGRLFTAQRAVQQHIENAHGGYLKSLIHSKTKYNTLTDNQKQLMELFASGITDKEIAEKTGVAVSTVRHQKFMFREKAKQARQYLAVYDGVFESKNEERNEKTEKVEKGEITMMPIHENATMVDSRYNITTEERDHVIKVCFSSLEPLVLGQFPPKEKRKIIVLARIAQEFDKSKKYSEKEVNEILKAIFDDFATIRRYLIEYGFMKRTNDGAQYWLS